ncbi:MAG: hypothetical protein Q4D60_08115 [Eubacteriales bacterium]|nr:hypothetical protein [Eubacteriales bacterium]
MKKNSYFQDALAAMAADFAYVGAVRHLHDVGMSAEEIKRNLTYPVSMEKIEKVIQDYEEEKKSRDLEYEIVQHTDRFGKRSFLRVKREK